MWLLLFFSYLCCPSLPVVAENDDVVAAVLFLFMLPILYVVVAANDDVVAVVLFLFMLPIPACCC